MKFLTTVIDLPRSMYSVQYTHSEIQRKITRILAICAAIIIYDIFHLFVSTSVAHITTVLYGIKEYVYHIVDIIITPGLPRVQAI